MATLKTWWKEFRRPKCAYCRATIEKGQVTCEAPECRELHDTMRMGV